MRRLVVTLAAAGVAAVASCALIDGLLGPALSTPEELCDEVDRIWADCSLDRDTCERHVECMRQQQGCDEYWDAWVRCLQDSEPECPKQAGQPMPCLEPYTEFVRCTSDDDFGRGLQAILSCVQELWSCGNGACELDLGESPRACHQDCTEPCSEFPGGFCTPFRDVTCSECLCDVDGICDPLRENRTTCPEDCACDNDSHCDAGESTADCPGDCPCDFDSVCDDADGETWLSCSDCGACDNSGCGNAEGQTCSPGIGCRVPLVCDEIGNVCRLPCLAENACPTAFNCDVNGMCLPAP